jgi:hypothetical protein
MPYSLAKKMKISRNIPEKRYNRGGYPLRRDSLGEGEGRKSEKEGKGGYVKEAKEAFK